MIRKNYLIYLFFAPLFLTSCISPLSKNKLEETKKAEPEPKKEIVEESNKVVEDYSKEVIEKNGVIELEKQEKFEEVHKKIGDLEGGSLEREKRIHALESHVSKLNFQINELINDNNISKKIISFLKNDVSSLNEMIAIGYFWRSILW